MYHCLSPPPLLKSLGICFSWMTLLMHQTTQFLLMQFFLDKYLHTVTKPIFLSKKISIFIKDNIWIFAPKFLFCENKIPKNMNFNHVTFLIKNVIFGAKIQIFKWDFFIVIFLEEFSGYIFVVNTFFRQCVTLLTKSKKPRRVFGKQKKKFCFQTDFLSVSGQCQSFFFYFLLFDINRSYQTRFIKHQKFLFAALEFSNRVDLPFR